MQVRRRRAARQDFVRRKLGCGVTVFFLLLVVTMTVAVAFLLLLVTVTVAVA